MRETIRSKSGRPLATSINSPSKLRWFIRSSTASRLGDTFSLTSHYIVHNKNSPGIDIGDGTQRHAQPDAEQPLTWDRGFRTLQESDELKPTKWRHATA